MTELATPGGATIPEVTHHTADVNGTTLHYVTAGDLGTPVLLVHGFPETWWAFRKLIPLLAREHRVLAVDLRGFGDSAPADEGYSTSVAAEDLHTLLESADLEPVHVVGQDVSGGVVYRLAATHPDSVRSLTAIESGLAGFGAEALADVLHGGVWYIGALATPGVAELMFEAQAAEFLGQYLYPMYESGTTAVDPGDIEEFARTFGRPGGFSGAAGLYRAMLSEGSELQALADARPLTVPVATIGSTGAGFTYAAFSKVTSATVTSLQMNGVGHYVAQEAPDALAGELLTLFAGFDSQAAQGS